MKNQLSVIVSKLLTNAKIPFDKNELIFQIQSHPSYPSLHSITGVLDHFSIENIAANVPINIETLKQLPCNFIAQLKDDNGQSLVNVNVSKEDYTVISNGNKKEKLNAKQFLEKFTGIIVAVEKPERTVSNISSKRQIRNFLIVAIVTLLAALLYIFNVSIINISYLLLSFIGTFISIAIIKQELGLETVIGNAFCSGGTEKKDCDAVLTSKGAEILNGYKLSDFSLFYFTTLTITSLLQINQLNISAILSLFAIPVVLYSFYYQYFIVKKWCLLCLSIAGVLIVQSPLLFLSDFVVYNLGLTEMVLFITIAFAVILSWIYLKPMLFEVNKHRKEKINFLKFQRNFDVFNTMLNKANTFNTKIDTIEEITLGNLNAKLEIVVITNPFCGHCKPVHKVIENILSKYENDVKIVIRFYINTDNIESNGVKVTTRILEIYKNQSKKETLSALHDIYNEMETNLWLEKWGTCIDVEKQIFVLKEERSWCTNNNINFTPEILINGKAYPKQYQRPEMLYFIENLIETN